MSMSTLQVDKPKVAVRPASLADMLDLIKPRITSMVLVTVALAIFVASGGRPGMLLLLHTLLGTALVAASSGAFNQWLERHTDALMERTHDRPVPAGRLGLMEVAAFGVLTLLLGTFYLAWAVGWQAAAWACVTWVLYVCVYTPMKPLTSWNTTVGAVSGALPICIGWAAVGSPWSWSIIGMLSLLFVWQFPHFIAIAWIYRKQYAQAGLQMVTTTDPSGRTAGIYAVLGAVVVIACSLLPVLDHGSVGYVIVAVGLGLYQLAAAWRFHQQHSDLVAKRLLIASIIYLPLALGLMAVQTVL